MEDLQTSDTLSIKSKIVGEYSLSFIDSLESQLGKEKSSDKNIYIIDENVSGHFIKEISVIKKQYRYIEIESGESIKTLDSAKIIIEKLIHLNIRKDNKLVAIGGGTIQDIVAFIASILFRGIDWVFYPTTLLAQCDSCIGSKTSINFNSWKNLLGTYKPPSQIYIVDAFLYTLSKSDIKSGIGEMLHYYFSDGIELAEELAKKYDLILENRQELRYFIKKSLIIKKEIIEIDEFDDNQRNIFNYGHTFGHAIEAITSYSIPHGQAISIGMDLANFIALNKNLLDKNNFNRIHAILNKNMPQFSFSEDNIEKYCEALSKDKKNKGNQLGCILCHRPGILERAYMNIDEDLKKLILSYSKLYLD